MKTAHGCGFGPLELANANRRKAPNLTIHVSSNTANFYATARDWVAMVFQLFGGNTAGQNVRVGCAKSTPPEAGRRTEGRNE